MDYKYIEQLLERYWECQTTLEEEAILRSFFSQADIPASLLPYRDLFLAEEELGEEHLGEDFDKRVLAAIEPQQQSQATVTKITFAQRLRPLYQSAAVVAILLTIGMAAQQGFRNKATEEPIQYSQTEVNDSINIFSDPEPLEKAEAAIPALQGDSLKGIQQ